MKYFFVLGNNFELSLAELNAKFKSNLSADKDSRIAFYETDKKINAGSLIKGLGGTIKIGLIGKELKFVNTNILLKELPPFIKTEKEEKYIFGFSFYGKENINFKPLAMSIKKMLKDKGLASRWVTSREKTLSSVVVEQNKLLDRGNEFILIRTKNYLLGTTLAIQPFKDLSRRDYGRPARDDRSGMLPPKLAQIMINLSGAGPGDTILDPFCGSGTVLSEAMLMGYGKLIGCDVSKEAINNTKENIEWLRANYKLKNKDYKLLKIPADKLSEKIKPFSVDAVITEPYLGPTRGDIKLKQLKKELEGLYGKALKEFKKILSPRGKIVMIWPVFRSNGRLAFLDPATEGLKAAALLNSGCQGLKLSPRKTIIYGRPNQRVWREIILLKKQA